MNSKLSQYSFLLILLFSASLCGANPLADSSGLRRGEWIRYFKGYSPYSIPDEIREAKKLKHDNYSVFDTIIMNDSVIYTAGFRVSQEPVDGGPGYCTLTRKLHSRRQESREIEGNFYELLWKGNEFYITGDTELTVDDADVTQDKEKGLFVVKLNLIP